MPGQLLIESRTEDDRLILSLRGELDLTSVPQFERELRDAEATGPARLVIDLGGLDFMDSTGLRALLQARERAKGDDYQLSLRPGPRQVQRVLELTKTLEVFTFED
jgi:anti-sigma B factor antagonist